MTTDRTRDPPEVVRRGSRWGPVLVATLLTAAVGVLLAEPVLVLLSLPGVAFAAYPRLTAPPAEPAATVDVERRVADQSPSHGDDVAVTVSVTNTGDRPLPDVRVVDGVPTSLSVHDGSSRHATALAPGETATFSYTVVAHRGVHRFESATVVLGDASGGRTVASTVPAATELACRSQVETLPIASAGRRAGTAATTTGESGVEFARVRDYRPGDPLGRIDWNRYARSGDLTTARFREDRARTTVLCLDARGRCYRSAGPAGSGDEPHAVAYGRAAARELLRTITDANAPVGLAVVGIGTEFHWRAPDTGRAHAAALERTLDDDAVLAMEPPDGIVGRARGGAGARGRRGDGGHQSPVRQLRTRLGRVAGVVFVSPLLDEAPVEWARTLRGAGHPVTVLSPDVTSVGSLGRSVATLRRDHRVHHLRRAGVAVVDWDPATPLETAIQRGVDR